MGVPIFQIMSEVEVMLSFGHKVIILSISKVNIQPKTSFTKVAHFHILHICDHHIKSENENVI